MTPDQINNNFSYHEPTSEKRERYVDIRSAAKTLAHEINGQCPDSREKSLAMTKLEEVVMWANASIARYQ